ncbi:zinc-dependent alcohol dehydrogenase [Rhodococcus chondri]|uniref:Alcohol dehydrogenase catalytic domain-containing protein n=1 Tax=Rhodococcus chondri TaxID=3065941 RepID=A0ABU7JPR0_9NOCA|nr:alcohol dehydrogenase catalytic domain-containing protein [Rhodococcus sp. CC-R104]MEE2032023.1 alcohol dehydrogenase catalytic domain-containing protein [Rhodococcus sp. CC-R104]
MAVAAVIVPERALAVTELDRPACGPGEVRIDVAYCGVCGSDLHLFFDSPEPLAGHVLGHEFSGVVSEVSPDVRSWTPGDRVVVRPIDECGDCTACRTEDAVCLTGVVRGPGLGRQGGLAESVTVPARMLHRIPDGSSLRDAALTEPLAVAVRGVVRAQVVPGDGVVVMGAGPIGLLTVEVLRARDITDVLVVEPNDARRALAAEMGVRVAAPAAARAEVAALFADGPRAVVDCSGNPGCAQDAVDMLGYGGRLVIVGMAGAPSELRLMSVAVFELTIIGSTAYSERDFAEALTHIAEGRVRTDLLITSVVGLDQADAKLRELVAGTGRDIKVLVRPDHPRRENP